MYSSARFYDAIYAFKDYAAEAESVHALIETRRSGAKTLLDVACGTGKHLAALGRWYEVAGVDVNEAMLEAARTRYPDIPFFGGDMQTFSLGRAFDAVTCLFSAVGYLRSVDALGEAVATMARHLTPGGVLVLEPWLTPEAYRPNNVHARYVDEPDLKIARINVSELRGRVAVMDMHYLVGTRDGVEHFVEHHELFLFRHEEYLQAFRAAGLTSQHDPEGLMGRGLYLGVKGER